MKHKWLDFWVGLFVVMGIAALVFLAVRVANQTTVRSAETYTISASFTNIGGLKVRSPVKCAGVAVGRVSNIQLNTKNYQAMVTLAIEKQFLFSTDTSASILTSGLLGEQYISLDIGGEEEFLRDGGEIAYTSSAMVLEKLIGEFMLGNQKSKDSEPGG